MNGFRRNEIPLHKVSTKITRIHAKCAQNGLFKLPKDQSFGRSQHPRRIGRISALVLSREDKIIAGVEEPSSKMINEEGGAKSRE